MIINRGKKNKKKKKKASRGLLVLGWFFFSSLYFGFSSFRLHPALLLLLFVAPLSPSLLPLLSHFIIFFSSLSFSTTLQKKN